MKNNDPNTWACACGQINLLIYSVCVACGGERDSSWDSDDRDDFDLNDQIQHGLDNMEKPYRAD